MRYQTTESVGEVWTSEEFEGEPKEIAELINGMGKAEEELPTFDTDDMIAFIAQRVNIAGFPVAIIKTILALELEYLKRKGIARDSD